MTSNPRLSLDCQAVASAQPFSVTLSVASIGCTKTPCAMTSDARPAKKSREGVLASLASLRQRMPYMSQSALAAVLREARDAPLPDAGRRADVRQARSAVIAQHTPYGPLVQSIELRGKSGAMVSIPVQHPWAMLHVVAKACPNFAGLLASTAAATPSSPSSPWGLCVYSDEVSPGNQLRHDNRRKMQVVYYGFLAFGAAALSCEDAWLVATTVRSSVVQSIDGGMSAVIGGILKLFFAADGHDMRLAGIPLSLHTDGSVPQEIRLHVALASILADEAALHATWLCKGASGTKPCVLCMNVVSRSWFADKAGAAASTGYFVPHSCTNPLALDLHTGTTIRVIVQELAAAAPELSKAQMDEKTSRL